MDHRGGTPDERAGSARRLHCVCGRVEIEARGVPIATTVCYCDTCQAGGRQIEALAGAVPVLDPDGGTAYVLFRKDRVRYVNGAELLLDNTLDRNSTTNRVVASCCNTAMVMRFDDVKHWMPIYRARFAGDAPPLQWRICTNDKPDDAVIPTDVPSAAMYPPGLMWKLLRSKIAMLFAGNHA